MVVDLVEKLAHSPESLTEQELEELISQDKYNQEIFKLADKIRKESVGDKVHIRGIIEFSNYCIKNCTYCGIRARNTQVTRYRISPEDILKRAQLIAKVGIKTVILQSGEDPYYTTEIITDLIREIKKLNVAVTLSIGERKFEEYEIWKEAGADRYLMRHETASEKLYQKLHPDSNYKDRIEHLFFLKKLGYETGAGNMVGLPGQTPRNLVEDILFLKKLQPAMVGIGPFLPHPETPLGDFKKTTNLFEQSLKMVALTRIFLPQANIPATTAMGSVKDGGREITLQCGANVIMPNLTPNPYRPHYKLYPEKICLSEADTQCIGCVRNMILTLKRIPD